MECGRLQVERHEDVLSASPIVVFDGNLNVLAMEALLKLCLHHNIPGECHFNVLELFGGQITLVQFYLNLLLITLRRDKIYNTKRRRLVRKKAHLQNLFCKKNVVKEILSRF